MWQSSARASDGYLDLGNGPRSRLQLDTRAYHGATELIGCGGQSLPLLHEEARLKIVPGRARYIFVYPFVKTREWYLTPAEERQETMDEHITVGSKYSRVKLNTTYSFGLDDQDFVVAFESNYPEDFLDLVQELRETKSSKYTVRDTPTYTCIARPIDEALDLLG